MVAGAAVAAKAAEDAAKAKAAEEALRKKAAEDAESTRLLNEALQARLDKLEQSNERLEVALQEVKMLEEKARRDAEEARAREDALSKRLAALKGACDAGDDEACATLTAEEEAKKSWLTKNKPAWSKGQGAAPFLASPQPADVPPSAPLPPEALAMPSAASEGATAESLPLEDSNVEAAEPPTARDAPAPLAPPEDAEKVEWLAKLDADAPALSPEELQKAE